MAREVEEKEEEVRNEEKEHTIERKGGVLAQGAMQNKLLEIA